MTHKRAPADYCPVQATMQMLNGKWTLHVVRELMGGRRRFNELLRAIGSASPRTLCHRLRDLEEEGILVREVKNTIPPWVEYELTEKGRALNAVIDSVATWGRVWMADRIADCEQQLAASEDCSCNLAEPPEPEITQPTSS
jgi:DNA-binding HxlR family transcriptional regulator